MPISKVTNQPVQQCTILECAEKVLKPDSYSGCQCGTPLLNKAVKLAGAAIAFAVGIKSTMTALGATGDGPVRSAAIDKYAERIESLIKEIDGWRTKRISKRVDDPQKTIEHLKGVVEDIKSDLETYRNDHAAYKARISSMVNVWLTIGELYEQMGDTAKAVEAYEKVLLHTDVQKTVLAHLKIAEAMEASGGDKRAIMKNYEEAFYLVISVSGEFHGPQEFAAFEPEILLRTIILEHRLAFGSGLRSISAAGPLSRHGNHLAAGKALLIGAYLMEKNQSAPRSNSVLGSFEAVQSFKKADQTAETQKLEHVAEAFFSETMFQDLREELIENIDPENKLDPSIREDLARLDYNQIAATLHELFESTPREGVRREYENFKEYGLKWAVEKMARVVAEMPAERTLIGDISDFPSCFNDWKKEVARIEKSVIQEIKARQDLTENPDALYERLEAEKGPEIASVALLQYARTLERPGASVRLVVRAYREAAGNLQTFNEDYLIKHYKELMRGASIASRYGYYEDAISIYTSLSLAGHTKKNKALLMLASYHHGLVEMQMKDFASARNEFDYAKKMAKELEGAPGMEKWVERTEAACEKAYRENNKEHGRLGFERAISAGIELTKERERKTVELHYNDERVIEERTGRKGPGRIK